MEIKYRKQLGDLLEHFDLTGDTVEIGVAEGWHSKDMISCERVTKHYMIDAWTTLRQKGDASNDQMWHDYNYGHAIRLTDPWESKRVVLKGMSVDMIAKIPDDSLVMAYVDGDHSFFGCLNDLYAVWPKIKVGGILCGHDFLNTAYGVNRAVKEFFFMIHPTANPIPANKLLRGVMYKREELHTIEEDDQSMAGFWIRKR